jgi:hypothetical protein
MNNDQLRCRSQAYIFEPVAPLELTVLHPSVEEWFLSSRAISGPLTCGEIEIAGLRL